MNSTAKCYDECMFKRSEYLYRKIKPARLFLALSCALLLSGCTGKNAAPDADSANAPSEDPAFSADADPGKASKQSDPSEGSPVSETETTTGSAGDGNANSTENNGPDSDDFPDENNDQDIEFANEDGGDDSSASESKTDDKATVYSTENGFVSGAVTEPDDNSGIQQMIASMTDEQKAAQLFIITPEALTGVDNVTQTGDMSKAALIKYPVGGLIYFAANLETPEQTKDMLSGAQSFMTEQTGLPLFLCVDEEGGRVARVAENPAFGVTNPGPAIELLTPQNALSAGDTIGSYLYDLGFNTDFAPDVDVLTNPSNEVIGNRSFGNDGETVANLASMFADGLHQHRILTCYKHFPGHGDTTADSHTGTAVSGKVLAQLWENELVPYFRDYHENADFVMIGHISLPNVLADDTPATLSETIVSDLLRNQLGYGGIIITDSMQMGAITDHYDSAQAALKAFQAGCDMILMPKDFPAAYEGILAAIKDGTIPKERLEASLGRILRVKYKIMQP